MPIQPSRRGRGRALYDEIKARVLDGTYSAGRSLPSTRACAADRGLSRSTVSTVYEQLAAEGFIETRQGSGARVAAGAAAPRATLRPGTHVRARSGAQPGLSSTGKRVAALALPPAERPPRGVIDFVYGPLAGRDFPTLAWLKAARQVERERPAILAYDDPRGDLGLRQALQVHLARARGLACDVNQIVVVNGSQQALDLCARLLVDPGDTVVVENPGYRMAHHAFESVGATLRGADVDHQGLETASLSRIANARLVYVTPTHQFPLGALMPMSRRNDLLAWAGAGGTWVVEDDYDSEYRYVVRPEATLQSIDDRGIVIYVGTFSKTLSPQLRLGYMVLPERLVSTFAAAKRMVDRHAPSAPQRTLARLLESGVYERHVRRMRRLQQLRRSALLEALDRHLRGRVTVLGSSSGLHIVASFDELPAAFEPELAAAARIHKVQTYPLGPFFIPGTEGGGVDRRAALVLGYASLEPDAIDLGVRRIATALRLVLG